MHHPKRNMFTQKQSYVVLGHPGRLPGTSQQAANFQEYADAWTNLAKPITDATGYTLSGFDPDLMLTHPDTRVTIYLSVHFAERLVRALQKGDST